MVNKCELILGTVAPNKQTSQLQEAWQLFVHCNIALSVIAIMLICATVTTVTCQAKPCQTPHTVYSHTPVEPVMFLAA